MTAFIIVTIIASTIYFLFSRLLFLSTEINAYFLLFEFVKVSFEDGISEQTVEQLRKMGHKVYGILTDSLILSRLSFVSNVTIILCHNIIVNFAPNF